MWVGDQLVYQFTEGRYHNVDPAEPDVALRKGYLMGWANSGFTETTDFFIDDITFYRKSPGW
jgi:hypothetical protein